MNYQTLKIVFPYTLPVLMGYIFMGIAFGVLLSSKGYAFYWGTLMGILIYAGSMQFIAIGLLTTPLNLLGAAILTFTVNARHLFYGLSLLEKFKIFGFKKFYMIFSLTDETYSLLCTLKPPAKISPADFYFSIAFLNHFYWILGCTLGGILGSLITFNSQGIDFSMTALFIVIFVEQWEKTEQHIPALAGILITALSLIFFGTKSFIIISMLCLVLTLIFFRKKLESTSEVDHAE
ncbi:AzlC family ABC transporter permease [Succinispira mobilis]|uniref:AzlC family ABC transporter permease n=1 Tax=Succinispira mobilis TaxID=78120 RepID=UPI000373F097|nr:AzlC family ABC transporter permease [Succinispira mobilis]